MLENQVKSNQKKHMEMVEKISSLYERLRLDVSDKYKFLSVNQVTAIVKPESQTGIKSPKVKNIMGHSQIPN